jgi:hypothetical protein
MPNISSVYRISYYFSGEFQWAATHASEQNLTSPGEVDALTLFNGGITIVTPMSQGVGPQVACIIIPPPENTKKVLLKAKAADVNGIFLHKTNPSVISLDPSQADFWLGVDPLPVAGTNVMGFRIVWL